MKKYIKPNIDDFVIRTTDVITTSSGTALNDIVKNVSVAQARTQVYDFIEMFGE